MSRYSFERQLAQPTKRKLSALAENDRLRHVIFAQQFTRPVIERLCSTALMIQELDESRDTAQFLNTLLSHKRAMLYFTQSSTRTFSSFEAACHLLGLRTSEVRDRRVSSEYKGESPMDSMRMYSSYNHVIVMRTEEPNFAERCAYLMNDVVRGGHHRVPIVNAGSGADEHPTQALLDIYTIERAFRFESDDDKSSATRLQELRHVYPKLESGIDGKTITFCGDIGRGRTVRSLATLLSQYKNVTLQFVSPDRPLLRLQPDLKDRLADAGVKFSEHRDLSEVIAETDLLYMTRVQTEHDTPAARESLDVALAESEYKLSPALVHRMRSYAPILHPLPRVDEVPTEIDDDPRAMYFKQAANGMYVRAALLAHLFDVDGDVRIRYADEMADHRTYNGSVLPSRRV